MVVFTLQRRALWCSLYSPALGIRGGHYQLIRTPWKDTFSSEILYSIPCIAQAANASLSVWLPEGVGLAAHTCLSVSSFYGLAAYNCLRAAAFCASRPIK